MSKDVNALLKSLGLDKKQTVNVENLSTEALTKLTDTLVKVFEDSKKLSGLDKAAEVAKLVGLAVCLSKEAAALSVEFQTVVDQLCTPTTRAESVTSTLYGGN